MTYFSSLLFHLFQSFSDFLLQLNWKWANIFNEISKYHSLNNCKYGFVKLLHSLLFNTSSELLIRVVLPLEGYVRKVSPVNFLQLFNFRFPFFLFFYTDGEGLGKLVSASHLHLRIIIVVLFLFYVSTKQQVLRESVFKYFCKKKKKNPSVGNPTQALLTLNLPLVFLLSLLLINSPRFSFLGLLLSFTILLEPSVYFYFGKW